MLKVFIELNPKSFPVFLLHRQEALRMPPPQTCRPDVSLAASSRHRNWLADVAGGCAGEGDRCPRSPIRSAHAGVIGRRSGGGSAKKASKISAKKNGGAEAPPPDVDAQVRD